MPKETLKIEGFHGGINTNADPRDISEIQSPDSVDVAIDSLGRIKTLGSSSVDSGTSHTLTIFPNRGLFTMNSDKQLDGDNANETLLIAYDDNDSAIDIKDSDGWDAGQITNFDSDHPVFYVGDGNLRAGDGDFDDAVSNKWFGYIEDERFDSLNADSGAVGWTQANQSIEKPIVGNCLISTPFAGSDGDTVNSSNSEYDGNVADASGNDVADVASVNLRVGVQYNSFRGGNAAHYNSIANGNKTDNTDIYPLFGNYNIHIEGTSGTGQILLTEASSITLTEEKNIIFGIWVPTAKYTNLESIEFVVNETGVSPNTSLTWEFSKEELKTDCWNIVSCNIANITEGDASGVGLDSWGLGINRTGTDCDVYFSGPVIADNLSIQGYQSGLYTFYHTYLYDDEKQESLPFLFTDTEANKDVNKVNILGGSLLFNFDTYVNPFNSGGSTYTISKRITGSRIYYKLEENDNFYLIGELDFVNKGFKWFPEAGEMAYSFSNTAETSGNFFGKAVIAKGISPNSANSIDTYRSINGYAANTSFIDAKFKTAVLHGRRVYIGNIRQPSGSGGKNHPDRMLKSAINQFDVFPDKVGAVDVAINDGESIVKLEAFADRILQFKDKTMYVINVSENVDFLEDTHKNKGCKFDYHVTKTDYGIAWFNSFGVYFYDGKQVINLLEKGGMRLISESTWESFIKGLFTDATCDYNDDPTITHDDDNGKIKANLYVSGSVSDSSDIPSGAYVSSVTSDTAFELSASTANGSHTNETLTFQDTDGVYSHIGYIPKKRQILIKNHLNDIFIYDFVLRAWMKGSSKIAITTSMTNFVLDGNQDLLYLSNNDADRVTWNPDAAASSGFVYQSKDIDFGEPSVRKKIYKVYITYKTGGTTNVQVKYDVDGGTSFNKTFQDGTNFTTNELDNAGSGAWTQAILKPSTSSEANNKYSFAIKFTTDGTVPSTFEINDISIIYRMKSIR